MHKATEQPEDPVCEPAAKLGPRAKRVIERAVRAALEQHAEKHVREVFRQQGLQNARAAVGWFNKRGV